MTKQQIIDGAMSLGNDERLEIAEALLLSMDPDEAAEVQEAWDEEIGRRVERLRKGGCQETPAMDTIERLLRKSGG